MHLHFRNCNDAFRTLTQYFAGGEVRMDSEVKHANFVHTPYSNPNGSGVCLSIDEPVILTYGKPCERVLFNEARDANPFLHLYEALYMLAGRNDVAPLVYYAKQMRQYSDDGVTLNGSYGYRWRRQRSKWEDDENDEVYGGKMVPVDQLKILIAHLKAKPDSRRAVLQMWSVEDDLLKIDESRDCCCNLSVLFSLRNAHEPFSEQDRPAKYLDMTVTNRSNDLIWGCLGANYVTFSFLQEYMAAHLGVEVGRYNQFSVNLHVYDWNFKPVEFLADKTPDYYTLFPSEKMIFVPLIRDPETFDKELPLIVEQYLRKEPMCEPFYEYTEPFLRDVAQPMFDAWLAHKKKTNTAIDHASRIQADDWRIGVEEWLRRRMK